ncbi:hypothetical protein MYAM1_000875 [Malassezia yamatoensis]|uniref:Endonuclease/exonuclease/phosphatase domain-containing protein n=1 Tax=Malassezia yamatoensis TaxID=253288 RepID=A0AAJ5YSU5_9BASI|nr:hypothetical protein MYAM1_000875 [Malassezia yamatoensis]
MASELVAKKRAERAARKARDANPQLAAKADPCKHIRLREWVPVREAPEGRRLRIVSWNMLAQSLVRRELFPGSDCLKSKDRFPGLQAELLAYDWDIGCFQEVDCIEEHGAVLRDHGYNFIYECGYDNKRHGLLIAWRSKSSSLTFGDPIHRRTVHYDDARPLEIWEKTRAYRGETSLLQDDMTELVSGQDARTSKKEILANKCVSRLTRNIALIVALPCQAGGGVIVATTHLFWHPRYEYERARQAAILVQEILAFRLDPEHSEIADWPVVLAGDFNDQPHSPTYTFLTGKGVKYQSEIGRDLEDSMVVHTSVDEVNGMRTANFAKSVLDPGDDDRALGRYRTPVPNELLNIPKLTEFFDADPFGKSGCLRSAYGHAHSLLSSNEAGTYFRVRYGLIQDRGRRSERYDIEFAPETSDPRRLESNEPMWTMYSSLFHLTLGMSQANADYIMLFPLADTGNSYPAITALLRLHPDAALKPGIPRKGVCSSDHVMLGAEILF